MIVIDGIYYAIALGAAGAVISWLAGAWSAPLWVLAAFCLYFFRDPERTIPTGPVAVSPADGKVVAVVAETATANRVSIFLNIFDVHVNRAPIGGVIRNVEYRKGQFLVASKELASSGNEQNIVTVQGDGTCVVFKQIAGLIARRIVSYAHDGDKVEQGQRMGLIRFGSRVDVFVPTGSTIRAKVGDFPVAGTSVLAELPPQ